MPHLKVLNLSFNPNIGPGGAVSLIRSLGALKSLEELDFNETAIGVEDFRALSELLSSSTSLKYLDVGVNHLPPEGVELIISGLSHNTTLKQFYMRGSQFFFPEHHLIGFSAENKSHPCFPQTSTMSH